MGSPAILQGIREAFGSALGIEPTVVSESAGPGDVPGWDSLGHVQLVSALESTFDLSFDVEDVMAMEDVPAIVATIESKLTAVQT